MSQKRTSITMNLRDGEPRRISSDPNLVRAISRPGGGLTIETRIGSSETQSINIGVGKTFNGEVGIFVPGKSAVVQSFGKNHEITLEGRLSDVSGSRVTVTGICPQNEPKKWRHFIKIDLPNCPQKLRRTLPAFLSQKGSLLRLLSV